MLKRKKDDLISKVRNYSLYEPFLKTYLEDESKEEIRKW